MNRFEVPLSVKVSIWSGYALGLALLALMVAGMVYTAPGLMLTR